MSEFRDLLEQERRRHTMSHGSFEDLYRRRDRKRRNRRIAAGLVALVIAAVGVGGGLYAFRPTGSTKPAISPSPSTTPPSPAPPVAGLAAPPISGTIEFIDDQQGWMVDGNGQILVTADGGRTWKVQLSGPSNITGVDMVDGEVGWGVGDGGLVHTTDGGAHWDTWGHEPLSSVQFVTPLIGWGVVSASSDLLAPGLLMKTEDGGLHWTGQDLTVGSVCAADENVVWAAGGGEGGVSLLRSDDGGASWVTSHPLVSDEPWMRFEVRCAANGQEAFLLLTGGGAAGHVAYVAFQESASGGQVDHHPVLVASFAAAVLGVDAYHDDDPYPGVFTVIGPGTAYFVNWCPACDSPSASFVKSAGQPSTVNDRTPVATGSGPAEPVGISFVSPDHGWVMFRVNGPQGQQTTILETTDGGTTWTTVCGGSSPACS